MKSFTLTYRTKIYFGCGEVEQLTEIAKEFGSHALIVTGQKSVKKTGLLDRVLSLLKNAGVTATVFDEVTPNPRAATVDEGAEIARRNKCNFLIGLGGGSAIDCTKAMAVMALNQGSILDYMPGGKSDLSQLKAGLPIVAIPTTAGTGTEVNKIAVISNPKTGEKVGLAHDSFYPVVAVVDPRLMVSMPSKVTAASGVDVFFHAMEGFLSRKANVFSDMVTVEAMRLVVENLEKAYKNGDDIEARFNMAWASTLGGISLDQAGAIGIHGLSHPLSGKCDLIHGETLAALAPVFLERLSGIVPERCARIARILSADYSPTANLPMAERAGTFLRSFLQRFGLNISLRDMGINKEMLPEFLEIAMATMTRALGNTPGDLKREDYLQIYEKSY